VKNHFSGEDVQALKKQEQSGCASELISTLAIFAVVIIIIVSAIALADVDQPGIAVAVDATVIYGPTELVLLSTPTLAATATHTPEPSYTPLSTYTPDPTQTLAPTFTPLATHTPFPTWTPAPIATPFPLVTMVDNYRDTRMAMVAGTAVFGVLIAAGSGLVLFSLRPDRDLKRLYKLLEMHLLTNLQPPAPVRATPAPVRTISPDEWRRERDALVQNTGVTGAPEKITVFVQPTEPAVDTAVVEAICELWNEILNRGERPSFNRVCFEYFGSKNSDRLAIVRRAVKHGRERGYIA